jgi:hypothetical protein
MAGAEAVRGALPAALKELEGDEPDEGDGASVTPAEALAVAAPEALAAGAAVTVAVRGTLPVALRESECVALGKAESEGEGGSNEAAGTDPGAPAQCSARASHAPLPQTARALSATHPGPCGTLPAAGSHEGRRSAAAPAPSEKAMLRAQAAGGVTEPWQRSVRGSHVPPPQPPPPLIPPPLPPHVVAARAEVSGGSSGSGAVGSPPERCTARAMTYPTQAGAGTMPSAAAAPR